MHLRLLPDELVLLLARHLGCIASIVRWGATSRDMHRVLRDDELWERLAVAEYGAEFWRRAQARPVDRSMPLGSWREELLRLERFQRMAERIDSKRMAADRFFSMWDAVDKALRLKHRVAT